MTSKNFKIILDILNITLYNISCRFERNLETNMAK